MSDEIRPIEGFGAMRQMSPYYGGADLTTPIPSQGITPIGSITGNVQQGQQVALTEVLLPAYGEQVAEIVARPLEGEDLSQIMKLLDDPAKNQQFCQKFQDYINKMYPENLMPPPGEGKGKGLNIPMGGSGLPMIPPGLGRNVSAVSDNKDSAGSSTSNQLNQLASLIDDELSLSGSLDDRIQQLQNALSDLEAKKSQLESLIQKLEAEIKELETQLDQLNAQKKELESQKQQKQQEMNQAKQEQQKLQNQKQQLKSQESQLTSQKQSLNSQITSLTVQIASLTSQIATLRASAASMHAQAAALMSNPYTAAAGAALEASACAIDAQAAALEAQKCQLQAEKQQAECQLQQVEAQLQQVKSQLQQVEQQLQVVENKIKNLEKEIAELDKKLKEIDEKIAKQKDQICEKKRELADKKAELAKIKLKIAKVKQLLQQHLALKHQQEQPKELGGEGDKSNKMDPTALLPTLSGLGKGIPPGVMGEKKDELREAQEQKAREALAAEFPGGPISMRAQKPDPNQEVSQYGTSANKEQVEQMLEQVAAKYGIPLDIMKAVAWNDSKFNVKSQSADGESKGAVHVAPKLNPDYDVAKGNQNPVYNLEFSAKKLRDLYERTQDWKIATSHFYGKDGPAAAMGAQIMALASQKPWETGSQGTTADAGSTTQKSGGKRA